MPKVMEKETGKGDLSLLIISNQRASQGGAGGK